MSELKDRLSEVMDENGYTANRLANEIGKRASTITRILNGDSQSSNHTLELISNIFGINKLWLHTGAGEKFRSLHSASGNNTIKSNLVKSDLIKQLDVIPFKGNLFIRTPFNKYLLLVPVLDEVEQAKMLTEPEEKIDIDNINRYPITVPAPTAGTFMGFVMTSDSVLNRLMNWEILEKEVLFVGRKIKKSLWGSQYFFHRHKLYLIVHNDKLLVREILSQPNEDGEITTKGFSRNEDTISKINLRDCHKIYVVITVCHSM